MTCGWRAVTLAALLAGCGGKDARAPVGMDDRTTKVAAKTTSENVVSGYMVASVGDHTLGPFFARRGSGAASAGLVAWVTVAEGAGRRVLVVPVGPKGAPRGSETLAAWVSLDTTMLIVRPMRGTTPGFLLAWTSLTDRGKSLWTVTVGDDGSPRSKPVELTRTTDDIVWVDAVPTDHGAVCLWAEETRGNDANLVAAAIEPDGKVRGVATRVAHGIVGWHALELPNGVGVSTVHPPGEGKAKPVENRLIRDARPGGTLSFHRLDADAHETGVPVNVTSQPNVSGDVEVALDGTRLAFAWTDRSATEPVVMIAAVDAQNHVDPPKRIVEAQGGASLLALSAGPAGLAVMFEAPSRRRGDARRIHAGRVGPNLMLARPFSLDVIGRGQPELASTTSGFAVLATTADCVPDSPACLNADAVATLHRIEGPGGDVQREPLTFLNDPATLGWGLTCDGDICYALAASPGAPGIPATPSRVRTVSVRSRAHASTATAAKPAEPTAPTNGAKVADVTAIASGESVVDLATAHFGTTTVVATLTAKADGAVGPAHAVTGDARSAAMTVTTRAVDENGAPQAPSIISARALQVGGVAIAAAGKPEDGGAIAWVARDNGDPEVHVTRIDKRGRRTSDVQLTTTKGDATDVTITWAGGGWIVAWVDGRDGNGEVYAAKIGLDLGRIGREERITKAPGDASDLVALASESGDVVWLAWADSRESPKDGLADVFVTAVRTKDTKRAFDEQRLMPTAAHSRTPQLAAGAGGSVYVAWIEEAPMGAETSASSGYGAFLAKLDAAGKASEKPVRIPLAGDGAATAVALESAPALHAVVARSTPDAILLDAVDLSTAPPRASAVLTLDGPPSLDVALVLDRSVAWFNDQGPRPADRRARRARLTWQGP